MFIWPGQMRRKARRQRDAILVWRTQTYLNYQGIATARLKDVEHVLETKWLELRTIDDRAQGYFVSRDWIGVEAAYNAARRIIDQDE